MFRNIAAIIVAILICATGAQAALITYGDTDLASGNPVTIGGTTLTTYAAAGGSISFIGSGLYTGLWLGENNQSGLYTLLFSESIDSIEIQFDALSSSEYFPPPEQLFNFATNNGPVAISYTNLSGTTFDGTTITSTVDDGRGVINLAGPAFTSFSFNETQGFQSGFVIEKIVVNTSGGSTEAPAPATLALFGLGLAGLARSRRQKA